MSPEPKTGGQKLPRISRAPAKRLLILFSAIFALWIGALVAMYFTTVYSPHTSVTTTTR